MGESHLKMSEKNNFIIDNSVKLLYSERIRQMRSITFRAGEKPECKRVINKEG